MYKVLIVDDEELDREGLKTFVNWNKLGFEVAGAAESAQEALEFMKNQKVDVVLTDIVMAGMDGLKMIKAIKEIDINIKSVILSGHGEFSYAQEAMRLGAYDYLVKPVIFEELERIFRQIYSILKESEREKSEKEELLSFASKYRDYDSNIEIHDHASGIIISNAKKYIQEHYIEEITLEKLSEVLYIHPIYLSRLFKKKTGENFIDYLTKVRVEKSKALLGNCSLKIYEIAGMVGYDSPNYYTHIFKKIVGMTPKEYQDNIEDKHMMV